MNTVFVIGAGASKEVKLPTGIELKQQISNKLHFRFEPFNNKVTSGEPIIFQALELKARETEEDVNTYIQAAQHISDALPQAISIDHFINSHKEDEKIAFCGKLAIVHSILEAEQRSLLYYDAPLTSFDMATLRDTWFIPWFQLLTENCGKNQLEDRFGSVVFVVFNYDRCVEHYLYHALQNYYRLPVGDVINIVRNIRIFHPYGIVGTHPLLGDDNQIIYGENVRPQKLLDLISNIKTFTEGTDPKSSEIVAIRNYMGSADRIVFLGFAFHKLNMELLTPRYTENPEHPILKCFATTYDISDSDKEIIQSQITDTFRNAKGSISVDMANKTCGELFTEYWRSLSF